MKMAKIDKRLSQGVSSRNRSLSATTMNNACRIEIKVFTYPKPIVMHDHFIFEVHV